MAAPLGLILGIVGVVRTGGGQRRGRGLAIAAIPVSLLTGLLSIPAAVLLLLVLRLGAFVAELPAILDGNTSGIAVSASKLRPFCSDDFNAAVNAERLQTWLEQVAVKHGRLVETTKSPPVGSPGSAGRAKLSFEGKFVNGPANITITFGKQLLHGKLEDVEVDGLSPRGGA